MASLCALRRVDSGGDSTTVAGHAFDPRDKLGVTRWRVVAVFPLFVAEQRRGGH